MVGHVFGRYLLLPSRRQVARTRPTAYSFKARGFEKSLTEVICVRYKREGHTLAGIGAFPLRRRIAANARSSLPLETKDPTMS